jgi:cell division protease FtsH
MTVFDSGADLANIVNEAGLIAIRNGRLELEHTDLVSAIQRVHFGLSRSGNIGLEELWETAYHEAGHTIVAYFRNRRERIQVVTIVPTGGALGYMWSVEKDDTFQRAQNKNDLLVDIEVSLGGLAAEDIHKQTTTNGVSSDLSNVARVARGMVKNWGMGSFKFNTDLAFGSYTSSSPTGRTGQASGETERQIENEIKQIVDDSLENVRKLLLSKRKELDKIAHALVDKETLYYKDLVAILEPSRTEYDINKEIATISERKMVGTPPVVNLDFMPGLTTVTQGGNGGGNGKLTGGAGGSGNDATGGIQPKSTDAGGGSSSDGPIT